MLAVRTEAGDFRGREDVPTPTEFPRLTRLQKIYADQCAQLAAARAPKLESLLQGYRQNLKKMKVELTRAKKIEDAVQVQGELDWLSRQEALLTKIPGKETEAPPDEGFERDFTLEGTYWICTKGRYVGAESNSDPGAR